MGKRQAAQLEIKRSRHILSTTHQQLSVSNLQQDMSVVGQNLCSQQDTHSLDDETHDINGLVHIHI